MSAYTPKSFGLHELVPPDLYHSHGVRAWELLDVRALVTLQALRDAFGPIVVNDWRSGGNFTESGLRSFNSTTGAALSQHRFGRAFDCKIRRVTPTEAAAHVLAHADEFPFLTTIENTDATPTWFHFDVRNHQREGIWIVNP